MIKPTLQDLLADWGPDLAQTVYGGTAVAIGLFDAHDDGVLFLNTGMQALLQPDPLTAPHLNYLLNPTLAKLRGAPPSETAIYEGWITFGGPALPHQSLRGKAWRRADRILIVAEHDVEELERVSREVIDLNGEITNLQRELARKNASLQATLDELTSTQAMLVQSEKMNALGQMVAGIAHEINNPVAFVNSNLHSLRTSVLDIVAAYREVEAVVTEHGTPDQIAAVQAIRAEADLDFTLSDIDDLLTASVSGLMRVKQLIENLRTFSRLDEADYKTIDLGENVQSALMIAQPQFGDRISFVMNLDDLPPVRCFPAELNQVFLNLIINAGQAIDGPGTITIDGEAHADQIVLTFTDDGRGMPPDVAGRVFDPFFTTKPVGSGTGLGLTIAYKIIVDRHGGSIDVESEPGRGTTFTIRLPHKATPPENT